jgi:hypothetical protein
MPIPKLHEAITDRLPIEEIKTMLKAHHSPTMFTEPSPLLEEIYANETPLQSVASGFGTDEFLNYKLDVTKLLIKKGAKLDAVNSHGQIALHYAAMAGNVRIAKALIDAGADTTIRDRLISESFIVGKLETTKDGKLRWAVGAICHPYVYGPPGTGKTAAYYTKSPAFNAALLSPASADWDIAEQEQQLYSSQKQQGKSSYLTLKTTNRIKGKVELLKQALTDQKHLRGRRRDGLYARDIKPYVDALETLQKPDVSPEDIRKALKTTKENAGRSKHSTISSLCDSLTFYISKYEITTNNAFKEVFYWQPVLKSLRPDS